MTQVNKIPFILASTSPRRIQLLKSFCLNLILQSPDINEKPFKGEIPKRLVSRLAQEKAKSALPFALKQYPKSILLGADTIVVTPNKKNILGKPHNKKEAFKMLKTLSGKTHHVLTGYCLLFACQNQKLKKKTRVVQSKVKICSLSDHEIKSYLNLGEWMDKAGGYAAQGNGSAFIDKIHGSYTNIIGLPLAHVFSDLKKQYGFKLFNK